MDNITRILNHYKQRDWSIIMALKGYGEHARSKALSDRMPHVDIDKVVLQIRYPKEDFFYSFGRDAVLTMKYSGVAMLPKEDKASCSLYFGDLPKIKNEFDKNGYLLLIIDDVDIEKDQYKLYAPEGTFSDHKQKLPEQTIKTALGDFKPSMN